MAAYLIRLRHSKAARLAVVLGVVLFSVGFCDDPYSPDRWLPGE